MGKRKYGFKHILIEDDCLFDMRHEKDTHGLQGQEKFIQRVGEVGAKDYEARADAS